MTVRNPHWHANRGRDSEDRSAECMHVRVDGMDAGQQPAQSKELPCDPSVHRDTRFEELRFQAARFRCLDKNFYLEAGYPARPSHIE